MSETTRGYGRPAHARITRQGQITVPKAVREALGALPGDDLVFGRVGEDIVIRRRPRLSALAMAGAASDTAPAGGLGKSELVAAVEARVGRSYRDKVDRMSGPASEAASDQISEPKRAIRRSRKT